MCEKGEQEFICGFYNTLVSAERNLFTAKNSVIKLCSGIMYLGKNNYTSRVIKRLYHKIYTFVLKLMPSTCCSGELACLIWRFLP
jgi:hypothetical protein